MNNPFQSADNTGRKHPDVVEPTKTAIPSIDSFYLTSPKSERRVTKDYQMALLRLTCHAESLASTVAENQEVLSFFLTMIQSQQALLQELVDMYDRKETEE